MKPTEIEIALHRVCLDWAAANHANGLPVAIGQPYSLPNAILYAVAPLIAAAERERCAKVAQDKAEGLLQAGEFLPVSHRFSYQLRETDARDLAAAIRAQGDA